MLKEISSFFSEKHSEQFADMPRWNEVKMSEKITDISRASETHDFEWHVLLT